MGTIGYIVAAGVVAAAVLGAVALALPQPRPVEPQAQVNNTTTVANDGKPTLLLILLQGEAGESTEMARFEPSSNESIGLQTNDQIRFESPDYRTPESMRVIAQDASDGGIEILRKSYDVNNEFFINLEKGNYELRVQASWFDRGTFIYTYDVAVA